MKKKSQKQIVKEILERDGKIDNYTVIEIKLSLRLGAIIHELRHDGGMKIDGGFIKGTKNFLYTWLDYPGHPPKKPTFMLRNPLTGLMVTLEEYNKL